MKKIVIAVMALTLNVFMFSCDKDSTAENNALYETIATEGDDGDVKAPPPAS